MRRREFLGGLGGVALLAAGRTSAEGRTYRLGTLTPIAPMTETSRRGKILIKALGERGFNLGRNLTLEARGAAGDVAKELSRSVAATAQPFNVFDRPTRIPACPPVALPCETLVTFMAMSRDFCKRLHAWCQTRQESRFLFPFNEMT